VEDAELARAIAGSAPAVDAAAEGEFCRRFAPRVRLYGLRHLRDRHAAADLVQQVLMMTLERLRAGKLREPERLAACLEALSERERSVVIGSFFEEESISELRLSAGNVRVIRHRALGKLRACMEGA
jgi:RNA polymerase sigma-70 factor (ECF subfamily)